MANITIQSFAITGTAPTQTTAGASGDVILDPQHNLPLFLRITNANGSTARTVTVDDPNTPNPAGATAFNPDLAITVPQTSTRVVKIADPTRFIAAGTGDISLTYSVNTDLTIEVYQ
jgi:hypothetical protein